MQKTFIKIQKNLGGEIVTAEVSRSWWSTTEKKLEHWMNQAKSLIHLLYVV